MRIAAELSVPGAVSALTADTRADLLYAAEGTTGILYRVRDANGARGLQVGPFAVTSSRCVATPNPTCPATGDAELIAALDEAELADLGCPLADADEGQWAQQSFEGGHMLWRGSTGVIYALLSDGTYSVHGDVWHEGQPEESCLTQPPDGRLQPVRGFGHLWCGSAALRDALGWATEVETGFRGRYQAFQGGAVLRTNGDRVLVLYRGGRWMRLA
jgi:hypothetical protein